MIIEKNKIINKSGELINLRKQLNCSDYGIYLATCKVCKENYVGQTMTSFSKIWNTHRNIWNNSTNSKFNTEETKFEDNQALVMHYKKKHGETKGKLLSDAYSVTLLEKPDKTKLDIAENFWIYKLNTTINISSTFLPKHK